MTESENKETEKAAPDEMNALRKKAAERDEFAERFARAAADYQNLRKRMERDIVSRSEDLVMDLLQGLFFVLDHLDLALRSCPDASEGLAQGVKMIREEIEALLAKQGVQPIVAQDAAFDPRFHEAVSQEAREGVKAGTILEELRRGFRLRDRVLRPSQVKVAAASTPAPPPESA